MMSSLLKSPDASDECPSWSIPLLLALAQPEIDKAMMSATKPAITGLNAELFVVLILITKAPLSSLPTVLR